MDVARARRGQKEAAAPQTSPPPDLAERLSPILLPSAGGTPVRLGTLWAERTVVLVHLRHFG